MSLSGLDEDISDRFDLRVVVDQPKRGETLPGERQTAPREIRAVADWRVTKSP